MKLSQESNTVKVAGILRKMTWLTHLFRNVSMLQSVNMLPLDNPQLLQKLAGIPPHPTEQ